jgi:hypothetical protein
MALFPPLDDFEPTRKTLHNYSQALSVIPRAHGIAHRRWWHISLKVHPNGPATDNVPLPDGGILWLRMDLHQHAIVLETSEGHSRQFSMTAGLTGTEMGHRIITAVAEFGLKGEYARQKFESDEPRQYDKEAVQRYFTALVNADRAFKKHKATLSGEMGPVQLWPHGFDLAFEWFGTRMEMIEEDGQMEAHRSQLNLGFYPGGDEVAPYFFSNPWPFAADVLLPKSLPAGARWFSESWQGSILPYRELVNDDDAEAHLLEYAKAVFALASPTLLA